jgi:hypothetical protein
MLAQNFMTAADLGLEPEEKAALVTLLGMLERGELVHVPNEDVIPMGVAKKFTGGFNMGVWKAETENCGSVCCIGGSAELVGGLREDQLFGRAHGNPDLEELFFPGGFLGKITVPQAASALRNYLTTRHASWSEVLS